MAHEYKPTLITSCALADYSNISELPDYSTDFCLYLLSKVKHRPISVHENKLICMNVTDARIALNLSTFRLSILNRLKLTVHSIIFPGIIVRMRVSI